MILAVPTLTQPVVPAGRMRALDQPTLAADGLLVRPWRADDAQAVFDAYQDASIRRWHVRTMASVSEAAGWIASWPGRWQAETGADWAVTHASAVAGRIGIKHVELWEGYVELAYWVVPAARGTGVAPRAVAAVSEWALDVLGVHRLELTHSTGNAASCRVATKAGFDLEGTMRDRGRHDDGFHDMHLHARLAG